MHVLIDRYLGHPLLWVSMLMMMPGCTHPTDPIDPPRKDPRTYTWTIDTIYLPNSFQTLMTSIWGSAPNDVYVTGHNSNNPGQMYHYNGTTWSEVALYIEHGGFIHKYVDMKDMIGFSSHDIWAGGSGGDLNAGGHLIHYDGKKWSTVDYPYVFVGSQIRSLGGTSSHDLWLGGENSNYTFHYDGSTWRKDSLPIIIPPLYGKGDYFFMPSIACDKIGNTYAIGYSHYQVNMNLKDVRYFFTWKNSHWVVLDSTVSVPGYSELRWGNNTLWVSPTNSLYSAEYAIFAWKNGTWVQMYDAQMNLRSIGGSSDENIFVVGDFGTVLHYNGKDWWKLPVYNDSDFSYYGVWTDGNEVFIVGIITRYPMKSVVIHGK